MVEPPAQQPGNSPAAEVAARDDEIRPQARALGGVVHEEVVAAAAAMSRMVSLWNTSMRRSSGTSSSMAPLAASAWRRWCMMVALARRGGGP